MFPPYKLNRNNSFTLRHTRPDSSICGYVLSMDKVKVYIYVVQGNSYRAHEGRTEFPSS